jgi:hypothetical protein
LGSDVYGPDGDIFCPVYSDEIMADMVSDEELAVDVDKVKALTDVGLESVVEDNHDEPGKGASAKVPTII